MKSEQVKVEIASYPKSGNTWMLHLLHQFLLSRDVLVKGLAPDIHLDPVAVDSLEFVQLESRRYGFYKSHIPGNPRAQPDIVIYIYRHPLDVFLSAINHHARNGNEWIFFDGKPRTVEQIAAGGELDSYFERFLENLGANFWTAMLGKHSCVKTHTELGLEKCRVALRYEDLFLQRGDALRGVLRALEIPVSEDLDAVFVRADQKTVGSGNPFFWRARMRTREEFLSTEQIRLFEQKHRSWLERLGYSREEDGKRESG